LGRGKNSPVAFSCQAAVKQKAQDFGEQYRKLLPSLVSFVENWTSMLPDCLRMVMV